MHPPHVPLVAEAQAADRGGPAHHGPCRRLLGEGGGVGELAVGHLVQLTQEPDGLEVLAAAVLVGDPFTVVARIVEVQHRGDGVDAQTVGVVAVEPAAGARQQEGPHLVAPVVEDRAVPVGVEALAGVGVLVEMGAVEAGEAVGIGGEVRRDPVQDDADPALVESVDHRHEVARGPVARGRREVAERLVAPAPVEGMLHDRQELDVGEAVCAHVVGEGIGEVAVVGESGSLREVATPRAQVHLVDRHGRVEGDARTPLGHPRVVAPLVVDRGDP